MAAGTHPGIHLRCQGVAGGGEGQQRVPTSQCGICVRGWGREWQCWFWGSHSGQPSLVWGNAAHCHKQHLVGWGTSAVLDLRCVVFFLSQQSLAVLMMELYRKAPPCLGHLWLSMESSLFAPSLYSRSNTPLLVNCAWNSVGKACALVQLSTSDAKQQDNLSYSIFFNNGCGLLLSLSQQHRFSAVHCHAA